MLEKHHEAVMALLRELVSAPADKRSGVTQKLRLLGADAVVTLGHAMGEDDKPLAKAATKALEDVTHHAARPGASASESRDVADKLIVLTSEARPRAVRAHALYLLGYVGRDRNVSAIARLQEDPAVGDDARMALERINSGAARKAIKRVKV